MILIVFMRLASLSCSSKSLILSSVIGSPAMLGFQPAANNSERTTSGVRKGERREVLDVLDWIGGRRVAPVCDGRRDAFSVNGFLAVDELES